MKAANEAKSGGGATPVIFDTLKAAQELRKTGFERPASRSRRRDYQQSSE